VTSTGPENKEVAKAPSPRRLMRVLTVFATVFMWLVLASALTNLDFFNGDTWGDHLFLAFFFLWITQWTVIWTWRAWSQPSGKSDRVVLMVCLVLLVDIVLCFIFELVPEPWDLPVTAALLLLSFPGFANSFRRLELSWTADGDMLPLVEGDAWPSDRHFLNAFCVVVFLALLIVVFSLLENDVSDDAQVGLGLLIPACASWAAYRIGCKRLAKQSPASEGTQKQTA